jgi:hypothetical protein
MQHAVVVDLAWDRATYSSPCQLTCLRCVEGQRMGTNFVQIGPTLSGALCLGMRLHVRVQFRLRALCVLVIHSHSPWCRMHPRKFWRVLHLRRTKRDSPDPLLTTVEVAKLRPQQHMRTSTNGHPVGPRRAIEPVTNHMQFEIGFVCEARMWNNSKSHNQSSGRPISRSRL